MSFFLYRALCICLQPLLGLFHSKRSEGLTSIVYPSQCDNRESSLSSTSRSQVQAVTYVLARTHALACTHSHIERRRLTRSHNSRLVQQNSSQNDGDATTFLPCLLVRHNINRFLLLLKSDSRRRKNFSLCSVVISIFFVRPISSFCTRISFEACYGSFLPERSCLRGAISKYGRGCLLCGRRRTERDRDEAKKK